MKFAIKINGDIEIEFQFSFRFFFILFSFASNLAQVWSFYFILMKEGLGSWKEFMNYVQMQSSSFPRRFFLIERWHATAEWSQYFKWNLEQCVVVVVVVLA